MNSCRNPKKRITALLLALLLTVGMIPSAAAEQDPFPAGEEILTDAPEEEDSPADTAEGDPAEEIPDSEGGSDDEESPDGETPDTEDDGREPTEEGEDSEYETEEAEAEEELPAPPYSFKGFGEDTVIPDSDGRLRALLLDNDVLSSLGQMTEGSDYAAGEVITRCDCRDFAEAAADALCGELMSWNQGVAVIRLGEQSVMQAVEAGLSPENRMPAVEPNYTVALEPGYAEAPSFAMGFGAAQSEVPQREDWESIVGASDTPDPLLAFPGAAEYQWQHDMIGSYAAWGVTLGSSSINVAVVDSGVNYHDDIPALIRYDLTGYGEGDAYGHGTHVAGIISASLNNSVAGAGVAPGVSIMSVRVLNAAGSGTVADMAAGISLAAENGADIINLSLGLYAYSATLQAVADDACARGVTLIAAAGNNGSNIKIYPAAFGSVIAVAAVNRSGRIAAFSNYGDWVDIAAPGAGIYSTSMEGGTTALGGTSQAAPMVSGAAALYMSKMGRVSPSAMRDKLLCSVSSCSSSGTGAGILDVSKLFAFPGAPEIRVLDAAGEEVEAVNGIYSVSCDGYIEITAGDALTEAIVYTTDGSKPAVTAGSVTNGVKYTEGISLFSFGPGRKLSFRAAGVSGIGATGACAEVTVKTGVSERIEAVVITGPDNATVNKAITVTAAVVPAEASQNLRWEITENSAEAVFDPATGKLSAKHNGTVTLRAVCVFDESFKAEHSVSFTGEVRPAASVKLSTGKTVNWRYYTASDAVPLELVATVRDIEGEVIANPPLTWTSSNPKVASVDGEGRVTCHKKGSSVITCAVNDGSGKKVSCTVVSARGIDSVSLSGQMAIARGKSGTYKVKGIKSSVTGVKIKWSISENSSGVKINSSGCVTVPSTADYGDSFTVSAEVTDGVKSFTLSQTVELQPRAKYVYADAFVSGDTDPESPYYSPVRLTYSSSGHLTGVKLYTSDIPDYEGEENSIQLYEDTDSSVPVRWYSSNPAVADVDESGLVKAAGAGSCYIYCAARDGSGKKATVKVTVTAPCSYIYISCDSAARSSSGEGDSKTAYLAPGKSAAMKATVGRSYGKPSSAKVKWSYTVEDEYGNDVTAKYGKYVTLTQGGVILLGTGLNKYCDRGLRVIVSARTKDRTYFSASFTFYVVKRTSYLRCLYSELRLSTADSGGTTHYSVPIDTDCRSSYALRVSSSKPDAAGAYISGSYIYVYSGTSTGKAVITLKALDGSGKTCRFTVYVTAGS